MRWSRAGKTVKVLLEAVLRGIDLACQVEGLREPVQLTGTSTTGAIESGLYYGFTGMIDGIVERVFAELGPRAKAIATGGQGNMIAKSSRLVKIADEDLTLEGLRIIWDRSTQKNSRP